MTALAMLLYESRAYRTTIVNDLQAQADIVGRASAPALAFNDPSAAQANLALLQARPQITGALIEDAAGRAFATYGRAPSTAARVGPGLADSFQISGDEILVYHPIVEKSEPLGQVVIQARYELASRLRDDFGILVAVLVGSLAVAVLLSAALQRGITQPIVALTDVAHGVMERRDFSLRVQKGSDDEVGYLVDAFNAMLAEVGRRAEALEQTNRSLSREMDERRGAEDALRAADRRKDEFLATLAHELRNPLAPLRNALTILKLPDVDAAVSSQAREMMERQLTQMVRLIDDLLDVSRITTGKLSLRKAPVALDAELRSAIDTAMPFIDARHHVLGVLMPKEWRPQIGFLDIGLPRINGYDLARRLRADDGTASMVLVAVTGWGQEKDRQMAVEAGFDRHLVKPVDRARVIDLPGEVRARARDVAAGCAPRRLRSARDAVDDALHGLVAGMTSGPLVRG